MHAFSPNGCLRADVNPRTSENLCMHKRLREPRPDPVAVLDFFDGAALFRDLIAAGVSRSALSRALDRKIIVRLSRGAYALADARDSVRARAVGSYGTLTCVSGAEAHGIWVLTRPRYPHLIVDYGKHLTAATIHRGRRQGELADPTTCVLAALHCLPRRDALVVAESSVVLNLCDLDELRARTRGNGAVVAREILDSVDVRSMSMLETLARDHLVSSGYRVIPQWRVPGVGRIDLGVWHEKFGSSVIVGVELDGYEFHSGRKEFDEDRRRGNAAATQSIPVLRFGYDVVVDSAGSISGSVHAALCSLARARGVL